MPARKSRTRLILCGSALTTMRKLLVGTAPSRGRAALEMNVAPFGFRQAAQLWGLAGNPELAFRVNALVGGTPAYLGMSNGPVAGERDFRDGIVRGSGFTVDLRRMAAARGDTELVDLSRLYGGS